MFDAACLRWCLDGLAFTTELDAAAAAAPQSAVVRGIKGGLMLRAERYTEAAGAYEQAAALDPVAAGNPDGRAQALSRLGQVGQALVLRQRALELEPQQAAPRINHTSTLMQAGQLALAAQEAEAAVRLDPSDQQAWAERRVPASGPNAGPGPGPGRMTHFRCPGRSDAGF